MTQITSNISVHLQSVSCHKHAKFHFSLPLGPLICIKESILCQRKFLSLTNCIISNSTSCQRHAPSQFYSDQIWTFDLFFFVITLCSWIRTWNRKGPIFFPGLFPSILPSTVPPTYSCHCRQYVGKVYSCWFLPYSCFTFALIHHPGFTIKKASDVNTLLDCSSIIHPLFSAL